MTNRKTYIIKANDEGGWYVWAEESERPLNVFRTKGEAVERAAELARKQEPSQVIIYKKNASSARRPGRSTVRTWAAPNRSRGPEAPGRGRRVPPPVL